MAEYLGMIKMGTLYKDDVAQPTPTKPWRIDTDPAGFGSVGDIADLRTLNNMTKWVIGNTSESDVQKLQWHKVKEGNKTLFICDRVLLVNVSWDVLNTQGYVTGKTITIDGQPYLCRILKGGDRVRNGSTSNGTSYEGGYLPNEWDSYITNEQGIAGIPIPTESDLDNSLVTSDRDSAHNRFWNWVGVYSWCQEKTAYSSIYSALRGCTSARNWSYDTSSYMRPNYGWRPVLEVLNSTPTITGTDTEIGTLSDRFTYPYTITDPDNDVVTVVESVDGVPLRTYTPTLEQEQTLTIDGLDWIKLLNGSHTATITATDTAGASVVRSLTFQKSVTQLSMTLSRDNVLIFSTRPNRIQLSCIIQIPFGEKPMIEVCNNALDENPAWESTTSTLQPGFAHVFKNQTKISNQWAVNIRVSMKRMNQNMEYWLSRIGGYIECQ